MKSGKDKKSDAIAEPSEKSIIVSNARIDRAGNEWKRKPLWLRQKHLGKLKVMAHFHGSKLEALIDQALDDYIKAKYDNSMAMKEMVEKSTGKVPTVKV
jgi:hypothetical protein